MAALLLAPFSIPAQAATFTVLSGASYQAVVAPNSWAVAFGTSMARSTATAVLDGNGQWPTVLAGTTVQVNGVAAALYYVSPAQINFLVPDGATFGSLNVVIGDAASGATQSSTVVVQNTAVGVYTSDSSGTGPGAILNGVTYAPAPFLVETPEIGGNDLRTRLAVYASGLRYAGNPTHDASVTNVASSVTARAQDKAGHNYNLAVEYAGAAPGFFGLDQVNVVLPAELDGAGVVSLTILTDGGASNVVTFPVNSLPASSLRLAGLTLTASVVTGGNSVGGAVSLNGRARAGGFSVALRSSLATLQLPFLVTIPEGQTSTSFTIATPAVGTMQLATVTAQAGGASQTADLEIDPASQALLAGFTVSPAVQGGLNLTGTLSLSGAAGLGGVNVQVSSDDPAAQPPAVVNIPFTSSSTTFAIPTTAVAAVHTVNLTAALSDKTLTAQASVLPALLLTFTDSSVTGGSSLTATVTLGRAAPAGGATLSLQSSDPTVARLPGTVSIAAGQTTATFTIATSSVTATRSVTITATYGVAGLSQSALLTVDPLSSGQLQSLTIAPAQVNGGTSATGTLTLSGPAPAGGVIVRLSTSSIFAAQVPAQATVAQGRTTVTFTITTSRVASTQAVTITASAGSITQTAILTVN